ncbi:MAG: diacylglycerol/polyprenol kinase family protein [Thermodesulfobacteriota bacterium]
MKKELIFELRRKLFHLFSIVYIPLFYLFNKYFGFYHAISVFLLLSILFLLLEIYRIKLAKELLFFNILYREKDKNKIAAHVYFTIGAMFVFLFFPFDIASVSLLMTTFGDAFAALIGVRFGRHKIYKEKSLEGSLAEFFVNLLIASIILNDFYVIFSMALTATAVEIFLTKIDDNLGIPLLSGFAGFLVA